MDDAQSDTDVRDYVATQVRMELARKRISVSEAARRLGWGQSVLQRRVVGQRPFEAGELVMLARLLDVPIERFFPEDLISGTDVRRRGSCSPLAESNTSSYTAAIAHHGVRTDVRELAA